MTRRTKFALGIGIGLGLPGLCCFGGLGYVLFQLRTAGDGLAREEAKAKSLGMPVKPAELVRNVPDSDNAAIEYRQAMDLMASQSALQRLALGVDTNATLSPADQRQVAESYRELTPLIPLLEKGAAKSSCDFRHDFGKGFDLKFPEADTLPGFTRLFCYKALVQAEKRDLSGALATMKLALRIGRHARETPSLSAISGAISCETTAQATLRRLAFLQRDNRKFLEEALKIEQGVEPLPDLRPAVGGELVMTRSSIRDLKATANDRLGRAVLHNEEVLDALDAKVIETFNWVYPKLPADPAEWQKSTDAAQKLKARVAADSSIFSSVNELPLLHLDRVAAMTGRLMAQRRLTDTAIRLCLARLDIGEFPAKLDLGEGAIDPFTNKPLLYKRLMKGFLLYSTGPDGEDHGGEPRTKTDIVFRTE